MGLRYLRCKVNVLHPLDSRHPWRYTVTLLKSHIQTHKRECISHLHEHDAIYITFIYRLQWEKELRVSLEITTI